MKIKSTAAATLLILLFLGGLLGGAIRAGVGRGSHVLRERGRQRRQ